MKPASEIAAALDAAGLTQAQPTEHALTGAAEQRWVAPGSLVAAARQLAADGFFFESMTCSDRLDPHGVFELLHTFNRYELPGRVALRTWVPKDQEAPSLTSVYGIAEWNEREAREFFGLRFDGLANTNWLLLPEGTEFHPLLKSFTAPPPSEYDDSLNPDTAKAEAGEQSDVAHH